ncbi:MAG: hypothetical protein HQL20_00025 [Candidatus Omnitrophica bacterium]|nr:hypothetical protein [Candidatus Omnitrophota bacterium]
MLKGSVLFLLGLFLFVVLLLQLPARSADACRNKNLAQMSTDQLIAALVTERNIQTCDGHIGCRAMIARALGQRRDVKAIQPLIDVLNSQDEDRLSSGASGCGPVSGVTYQSAVDALAQFGPAARAAVPRLQELKKSNPTDSSLLYSLEEALRAIAP